MLDVEQHTWAYDQGRYLCSKEIVDRVGIWTTSRTENRTSWAERRAKRCQTIAGEDRLRWDTDLVVFGKTGGSRGARDKRSSSLSSSSSSSFPLLLTSFFRFERSSWSRRFRLLAPDFSAPELERHKPTDHPWRLIDRWKRTFFVGLTRQFVDQTTPLPSF